MLRSLISTCALGLCLALALVATPAAAQQSAPFARLDTEVDYVQGWMQLLYDRVEAENRNVPQAARIYGYAGVTLYLAIMPGMESGSPGLAVDRLNGLPALPAPDPALTYDQVSVAIGALRTVVPALMAPLDNYGTIDTANGFNTAESNATIRAVSALVGRQYGERVRQVNGEIVERSIAYGDLLGAAIVEWAAGDGFAQTRDATAAYVPPAGEGLWTPTTQGQRAMEPYWGELRPFVLADGDACTVALDVPYDVSIHSTLHMQAMEVYAMSWGLTDEQREIAAFWDERVGESGTASGHWIHVQNSLVDDLDLSLDEAATMYALVGVTMADSFISAWQNKYVYNLPRPETYITDHLDPDWRPYRQAPPFPAYPSGHAVLGGAVAEALTALFGPVAYTDRYGVQYGMKARQYTSFEAAAYENALSRLYAGVHYRVDMENGLEQGRCVGETAVAALLGG